MKNKCEYCGLEFEDWEIEKEEEYGIGWDVCPRCKSGDFFKIRECAICGEEHKVDELHGGVCVDCINKYRKNFDVCYGTSRCETVTYNLSAIFATLLTDDEIDSILREHIKKHKPDIDCSVWIDGDLDSFGEKLIKEVIG